MSDLWRPKNLGISNRMTEYLPTEKGVPIRMPSTALFPISSADRFPDIATQRTQLGDSPYDFLITRSASLLNGFFTRIAVSEINFPWNFPNINGYLNTNRLFFDVSGTGANTLNVVNHEVSLTAGDQAGVFATCGELAFILEAVLDSDPTIGSPGVDWTVGFEVPDNPISAPGFFIDASGAVFKVRPDASVNPRQRQLFDMMGLRSYSVPGESSPQVFNCEIYNKIHRSSRFPSMLPRKYIDIVSENLTYNQDLKDSSSAPVYRDTMCRLYLTPEPGIMPYSWGWYDNSQTGASDISGTELWNWGARPFSIQRQFVVPKQIKWSAQQPIGQIRVQVYDDSSTLLPAQPEISDDDWYMTLQVSEV